MQNNRTKCKPYKVGSKGGSGMTPRLESRNHSRRHTYEYIYRYRYTSIAEPA